MVDGIVVDSAYGVECCDYGICCGQHPWWQGKMAICGGKDVVDDVVNDDGFMRLQ